MTFDSAEDSKKFVATTGFNWPIIPNARPLLNTVGVKGYPTLALLDPQGKVIDLGYGDVLRLKGGSIGTTWLDSKLGASAR